MNKPVPNGKEVFFDFDELFFSTTSQNGMILYCNEVFQRVSGYNWEQLDNAPHSIIRHPDMPRCVFKLLWETVKAGKAFSGYIKNMAADGSYFWVLASVFPVKEGDLSIYLKPSSVIFKTMETIYADVLTYEKEKGMNDALNYLMSKVTGAGFPDYEALMTAALTEEMKARELAVNEKAVNNQINNIRQSRNQASNTLDKISSVSKQTTSEYLNVFKKIAEFENSKKLIDNKTNFLLDSFQDFELISLNMRVFAALLGDEGASLGVIASEFREIVGNIEKHFKTFESSVLNLSKIMSSASLQICFVKLQFDMIESFARESLIKISKDQSFTNETLKNLETYAPMFLELARQSYKAMEKEIFGLHEEIIRFGGTNKGIKKFVNGLEVIAQMGSVESARLNSSEQSFNVYIKRMEEFTEILKNSTNELARTNHSLDLVQAVVYQTVKGTMLRFDEILTLARQVQNMKEPENQKSA